MKNDNIPPQLRYDLQVAERRHSPYMDYPAHVHLETMAACNARCSFCPSPRLKRKGAKMSDALLEKLLGELAEIPDTLPFQLSPLKVNEPLLDPRMPEILERIDRQLPQAVVTITTNAAPLSDEIIEVFSQLRGLDSVWVSLNEHDAEAYARVMGLGQEHTLKRLDELHRRREQGAVRFKVVLSRVGDGTPADREFVAWCRAKYPAFQAVVFPRGDWLGQVEGAAGKAPRLGCKRWFELSVTATGAVAHCCMDGQAEYPIGDASRQHLLEIYNAPHWRRYRERTVWREHIEPCARCAFL